VLPHHHDGFAVERRVLHDIGRGFLSTAVQGLDLQVIVIGLVRHYRIEDERLRPACSRGSGKLKRVERDGEEESRLLAIGKFGSVPAEIARSVPTSHSFHGFAFSP